MGMVFMAGCTASREAPVVTQPVMQPITYQEPAPAYDNPGSLYNPNQYRSIYEDGRARRVGDIVTINVVEQQSGSQEVTTDATRTNTTSASIAALGKRKSLFGIPIGAETPILRVQAQAICRVTRSPHATVPLPQRLPHV